MTTIVGLHIKGVGTVIGSDRQYTTQNLKRLGEPKWILANGWAAGVCGGYRLISLLKEHFVDIATPSATAFEISNGVIAMMKQYDMIGVTDDDSSTPNFDSRFMLANGNELWELDSTLSAMRVPTGVVESIGSGSHFAIGAGYALRFQTDHESRVRECLLTAVEHDIGSGGKPWVYTIPVPPKPVRIPR